MVVLVLTLLAAGVPGPTATASSHRVDYAVELAYHVHDVDPANGTVTVTLTILDPDEHLRSFEFLTATAPYPASNFTATGGTVTETEAGIELTLEEPEVRLTYDVEVNRRGVQAADARQGSGDAYHSYLASTWGVLKAEAFGLGFNVVHNDRVDPVWDGSLSFSPPDGWRVEGPWLRMDGAYQLPRDEPLPKGFVALGNFTTQTSEAHGRTYRYAKLGDAPAYEVDLLPYMEASTPYLATVYGNHTGPVAMVVSAPDPMFRGGLGGWNSLYVHDESSLKTLAHEHAHVWQGYRAKKVVGDSSLWIIEGDADYHGPLSLLAAEFWSPRETEEHFENVESRGREKGHVEVPLTDAVYGNEHERVAYVKGALVMHALDGLMRDASDGRVGVADLVRTLNAEMSPANPDYQDLVEKRVTNARILDTVEALVNPGNASGIRSTLGSYINTSNAPTWTGLDTSAGLSLVDLTLDPAASLPGQVTTAHVTVRNTGATTATRTLELLLNGTVATTRDVTLDPGRTEEVLLVLPDRDPGTYPVRVAYLTTTYHVLQPAHLTLDGVSLVPASPHTGSTAEVLVDVSNVGEAPGNVTVHVSVDGNATTPQTFPVAGGLTRTLAVAFPVPDTAGTYEVTVQVTSPHVPGEDLGSTTLSLEPVGDRDGDGVYDDEDDFPDDPRLTKSTPVSDIVHQLPVPGPGVALTLGVLLGLALVTSSLSRRGPRR